MLKSSALLPSNLVQGSAVVTDLEKLKSLVHYICAVCSHDLNALDEVKLHEILWIVDAESCVTFGKAVMGEEYTRGAHGPESVHLDSVLRELVREGHLSIRTIGNIQQFIASTLPTALPVSAVERRTLEDVIQAVTEEPAWQVLDSAHQPRGLGRVREVSLEAVWQVAEPGEVIPYQEQLVSHFLPLTESDQQWVESQLKDLK